MNTFLYILLVIVLVVFATLIFLLLACAIGISATLSWVAWNHGDMFLSIYCGCLCVFGLWVLVSASAKLKDELF